MSRKKRKRNAPAKPENVQKAVTKIAAQLLPDDEVDSFVAALINGSVNSTGVVWNIARDEVAVPDSLPWPTLSTPSWWPAHAHRVSLKERPGADPLHEEGQYYCMDASSILSGMALLEVRERLKTAGGQAEVIIDLCAAPGGKSFFARQVFPQATLYANEFERKRVKPLCINFDRCAVSSAIVTWSSTQHYAAHAGDSADVVIVDAPCSGQSLLARGMRVRGAFHAQTVQMNVGRQRRILRDAMQVVRPGGYLAYMTCTFSREENEKVMEWFLKTAPEFEVVPVPALEAFRSLFSPHPCYRMWPHRDELNRPAAAGDALGSGSFVCLFHKKGEGARREVEREPLRVQWERD